MDHKSRLRRLRLALNDARRDELLITHLPNIHYVSGFTGSAGVLVVSERDCVLFTDGRYTQQAGEELEAAGKPAKLRIVSKSALVAAGEWLAGRGKSLRVGIEATQMTVAARKALAAAVGRGLKLVDAPPIVERLRMVKSADEIAKIRAACHLTVGLFQRLLKTVRAGVTESQIAGELEFEARKAGAEQMAFPTIVAAGARSALPHGRASNVTIPRRGFVVCDFGVILAGYCSDMTRTLHVGRQASEARTGYEAVREAQQAAVEAVKPGVTAGDIDQAARKLLYNRGLAKYFTHSTGHGVGLEIHEAPRLAAGQNETLQPGMVITIEPGIYLPGKWGVRIEDTVVVTTTGCEVLTACPRNLITL